MTRIILKILNSPILIFLFSLGIALQSSLFNSWPLYYFQPDLVLLMVIWFALRRRFEEGGILSLIVANLAEIHSATPQGVHLLLGMLVFLLVRYSSRFLMLQSLVSYSVVAMVASFFWRIFFSILLILLGVAPHQWKHNLIYFLFGTASQGFFSIWIYRWLEAFDWITFKTIAVEREEQAELEFVRK